MSLGMKPDLLLGESGHHGYFALHHLCLSWLREFSQKMSLSVLTQCLGMVLKVVMFFG